MYVLEIRWSSHLSYFENIGFFRRYLMELMDSAVCGVQWLELNIVARYRHKNTLNKLEKATVNAMNTLRHYRSHVYYKHMFCF